MGRFLQAETLRQPGECILRWDTVYLTYLTAQYNVPVIIAISYPVVLKDEYADSSGNCGRKEVKGHTSFLRIVHTKTSKIKNGQTQRSARRIGSDFIILRSHEAATCRVLQARSA